MRYSRRSGQASYYSQIGLAARHGTTTLYAALRVLDGAVIGECRRRHRSQEFVQFLRRVERATPRGLQLHLILDNLSAHKSPQVRP